MVDWTWIQVGSRDCWIFSAIDPKNWRLLYLYPTFYRDGWEAQQCFRKLYQIYGKWPKEVLSDYGEEFGVGLTFLPPNWVPMRGGEREEIEGWFGESLKMRVKDFDKYFPSWKLDLKSVNSNNDERRCRRNS